MPDLTSLNTKVLRAFANRVSARNDIRYHLNAVHVEPHPQGGALYVATDGHCAALYHDMQSCPPPTPLLLDAVDLRRLAAPGAIENVGCYVLPNGKWVIGSIVASIVEGVFPDFTRIISNDFVPDHIPTADTRIINRMTALVKDITPPGRFPAIAFRQTRSTTSTNGNPSIMVFAPDTPWFLGVLMPVRSNKVPGIESWVKDIPPRSELAKKSPVETA